MGFIVEPNDITVTYEEMDGSPVESIGVDGATAERKFKMAWDDRMKFIKEVIGWTEYIAGDHVMHEPHLYQPEGFLGYVVATRITGCKGFGIIVPSTDPCIKTAYNHCILTVHYETPDWIYSDDPSRAFIDESIEPHTEFLQLPAKNLYWDTGGLVPVEAGEAPAALIRSFDWVYTIHRMAVFPLEIISFTGCTNAVPMLSFSLGIVFAVGTLLFGNPSLRREHTGLGVTLWSVTIRLSARIAGWNRFPRVDQIDSLGNMEWSTVKTSGGSEIYPYPFADFSGFII